MSIRVGMGTGLGANLSASDYWRWVDFCEETGVDSIWHSDQLLGQNVEPMAMLAALAARTNRMKFGTNALVVPFRDPLVVAKQFATIEWLSEGRLFPVVGVGIGNDPYWEATGTSPKGRGGLSNEWIVLVRQLLDQEEVSFEGEHFTYHGPGVHPRPMRKIPLWIGGNSKAAVERTAAIGDGWLGSLVEAEKAGTARRGIEEALTRTGRNIDSDHYGMSLLLRVGSPDDPGVERTKANLRQRLSPNGDGSAIDRIFAVGTPEDVTATLRHHVEAGMSKFVILPLANDIDDLMEQTRCLVDQVMPQVEDRS
ncbi:MAG: LLM class flavin-dependent oxidoreductase [Novosphingobium sp.]|nr:LLM class flavin-dependent oxidoreductase [Novosphingobium sp.]